MNQNAEKIEVPALGENSKNNGADDVTSSRGETQANDQTNVPISNLAVASTHDKKDDAPNCNAEFLKPATAESAMHLSNQGMKLHVLQFPILETTELRKLYDC